ncbi:hypothetical protein HHI36_017988 [Cryptolaemus montrouzieri]|uniref:AAA+ ATPase domain-containing protein n=1 Tax=Cryptolaemus montrouzieri TaxID=559131 RepID=A0ABD2NYU9_9CUCU
MGKISRSINNLSNSVQIIPISAATKGHKDTSFPREFQHSPAKMQRMPMPYLSDSQLIPRVQKYLESNVDKTYVDIGLMADELQNTYREYSKRKRSAFRASVKKAYSIVLRSYGIGDDQNGSSSEDDLEESESESSRGDNFHNSSMNNQLMDLYSRNQMVAKIDENELIDISSDDSEEGDQVNNKASNGPSTSNKTKPTEQNSLKDTGKFGLEKPIEKLVAISQGKKRKFDSSDLVAPSGKKKKSLATLQEPAVTFKDVAGIDKTLIDICKLLTHVKHPEVYRQIGISPPRGFLLHGPPGCGKTLLANAIAGELGVTLLKVSAPELVAGVSGESEERVRELFERAVLSTPCVLFIDEIDAITPNRQNAQKDMERRIVAQLITCLDDLNQNPNADRVVLIGATNRPDAMDPALRRAGRFDREIRLGIPDEEARIAILKLLTTRLKLSPDFDWHYLGSITPGYVGADLVSLTREASMVAVNRMFSILKKEQKKAEELARLKKIAEDKKKEEKKLEETKEADKSDPEIIVDDDPKDTNEDAATSARPDDSPVLVIEDDNSKQDEERCVTPIVPGEIKDTDEPKPNEATDKENEMVPEPIEESIESYSSTELQDVTKSETTLEDLLKLLHSSTPVNQSQLESLAVTKDDFIEAAQHVQPSAKREGFATVPDVSWDDVGSLKEIREELMMSILAPARHKEYCKALGITIPAGVLLCGPPGCGKTLLAKAVANEAGINFISVKGPELLNMYVGESERAVRTCFERARNSAPCVIFFDELDALCPKRSDSREGGATMRVVNQMLTEMDGIEGRTGVFLLAATNRPDIVDPAVLRPGRLDKILYVGLPSALDRVEILKTITKNGTKPPFTADVDLEVIGRSEELSGYTGADLAALVREAAGIALREAMRLETFGPTILVSNQHLQQAIAKIRPSVTEKDQNITRN